MTTSVQSELQFSNSTMLSRIVDQPPFFFEGVTMRVFPVRANLARVREFCEQYINFAPGEIARYNPFVPYVYVCLINYGRMQQVQSVGWVAQNEIAFTIPLQWFRRVGGKWEFQDFVSFSPFIYVDIEMSEITGREVYGWPKEFAFLSKTLDNWARNPRARANLLSVERRLAAPDSDAGWQRAPFLDVLRRPAPSFSEVPTEFDNLFNPAAAAARMAWGSWFVFRTLGELAASSPLRGFSATRPETMMAQLNKIAGSSSAMAAGPFAPWGALQRSLDSKTMNLKQFHMAGNPGMACYQALVHADMKLERFNRGGLLGDANMLLGDPTGGYLLRLHRATAGNLIDALGIEGDGESGGGQQHLVHLRPVLPFWVDLDLRYGVGHPIGWRVPGERSAHGRDARSLWWRAPDLDGRIPPVEHDDGRFRDARADSWEAAVGPYMAPQVATRAAVLKADPKRLEAFCDAYLNAPLARPSRSRFEPWGSRVFLTATNYESITDGNGTINSWVHRELAFMVPVIWRRDDGAVIDVGFVHAFLFADSDIETIMLRERVGLPVIRATLGSPQSIWMQEFQPNAGSVPLLELRAEVLGAFAPGERVEERKLLEIEVSSHRGLMTLQPPGAQSDPGEKVDPKAVAAAVKALEKLVQFNGTFPMSRYTLKEYPDASDAQRACYQSLIYGRLKLEGPSVVPFKGPGFISIAIERYPSFPIVEVLGLEVDRRLVDPKVADRVKEYLVPEESFWVQSDTRFELEEGFFWSGRDGDWQGALPDPVELPFDPDKLTPGAVVKKWVDSLRRQDTEPGLSGGS